MNEVRATHVYYTTSPLGKSLPSNLNAGGALLHQASQWPDPLVKAAV